MAKSKAQIIREILKKYPIEPRIDNGFKWIKPTDIRYTRNKAMRAAGIKEYTDELGHTWKVEQVGKKTPGGTWRNITGDRRPSERAIDPRTGKPGTRYPALRRRTDERIRNLIESNADEKAFNIKIRKYIAEHNAKLSRNSPHRYVLRKSDIDLARQKLIFEHRVSQADWKRMGLPGNPADSHNIWVTTAREAKQKTRIESVLRNKKGQLQTHYVDMNPTTRSFHILPVSEFSIGKEAIGGVEIPEAEWDAKGFKPTSDNLNPRIQADDAQRQLQSFLGIQNELQAGKEAQAVFRGIGGGPYYQQQLGPDGLPIIHGFEEAKKNIHLRDQINNKLNSIYTTDPSDELYSKGLWHDGKSLDDSWVKITRDLNTDSGKFANGKWTPAPDPTARTSIDILSDIGQGEGEFSDIVNLKNKFHNLKRTLPPGEYYMSADNYTKAMYYQRAFRNDPWVGPSGEKGGQPYVRRKDGKFNTWDTLKLTVPDVETQLTQAQDGPYPRWQDQGVPQSALSKATPDGNPLNSAAEIARRNEVTMLADKPALRAAAEASGGLKNALKRAGSVLPFVGAGLDTWDAIERYNEMMNNPNSGFTDWLDKAQFGIASATVGTSFWAEPANFALGMTNLGIDAMRTIFEREKRDDFGDMMRGITRGIGHVGQKLF